jgi:hypothetical protein
MMQKAGAKRSQFFQEFPQFGERDKEKETAHVLDALLRQKEKDIIAGPAHALDTLFRQMVGALQAAEKTSQEARFKLRDLRMELRFLIQETNNLVRKSKDRVERKNTIPTPASQDEYNRVRTELYKQQDERVSGKHPPERLNFGLMRRRDVRDEPTARFFQPPVDKDKTSPKYIAEHKKYVALVRLLRWTSKKLENVVSQVGDEGATAKDEWFRDLSNIQTKFSGQVAATGKRSERLQKPRGYIPRPLSALDLEHPALRTGGDRTQDITYETLRVEIRARSHSPPRNYAPKSQDASSLRSRSASVAQVLDGEQRKLVAVLRELDRRQSELVMAVKRKKTMARRATRPASPPRGASPKKAATKPRSPQIGATPQFTPQKRAKPEVTTPEKQRRGGSPGAKARTGKSG